jgi:hypothetical protein
MVNHYATVDWRSTFGGELNIDWGREIPFLRPALHPHRAGINTAQPRHDSRHCESKLHIQHMGNFGVDVCVARCAKGLTRAMTAACSRGYASRTHLSLARRDLLRAHV